MSDFQKLDPSKIAQGLQGFIDQLKNLQHSIEKMAEKQEAELERLKKEKLDE